MFFRVCISPFVYLSPPSLYVILCLLTSYSLFIPSPKPFNLVLLYTLLLNLPFQSKLILTLLTFIMRIWSCRLRIPHVTLIYILITLTLMYYPVPAILPSANSFSFVNNLLLNPLNNIHPLVMYSSLSFLLLNLAMYLISTSLPLPMTREFWYFSNSLRSCFNCVFYVLLTSLFTGSWWALQVTTWDGWWNWDSSEVLLIMFTVIGFVAIHVHTSLTTSLVTSRYTSVLYISVLTYIVCNSFIITFNQHLFFSLPTKSLLSVLTPITALSLPIILLLYRFRTPLVYTLPSYVTSPNMYFLLIRVVTGVVLLLTLRLTTFINWKYLLLFLIYTYTSSLFTLRLKSMYLFFIHYTLSPLWFVMYLSVLVSITSTLTLLTPPYNLACLTYESYCAVTSNYLSLGFSMNTSFLLQSIKLVTTVKSLVTPHSNLVLYVIQSDNYNLIYLLFLVILLPTCTYVL